MKTKVLLVVVVTFAILSGCIPATYLTLPPDQHSVVKVQTVDMKKAMLYSLIQHYLDRMCHTLKSTAAWTE